MTDYTQLHYNVDNWYESINVALEFASSKIADSSKCNQYMYAMLSCISEFPEDYE